MKTELLEKLLEKYLLSEDNKETTKTEYNEYIWQYVILRWYDSWVHFWSLEKAYKDNFILSNTRRLWYWNCKKWIWLSSVAQYWLADNSKITCALDKIQITDKRISEIIPCTDEAIKSIQDQKEYIPN